jgi:hypothetical protein
VLSTPKGIGTESPWGTEAMIAKPKSAASPIALTSATWGSKERSSVPWIVPEPPKSVTIRLKPPFSLVLSLIGF